MQGAPTYPAPLIFTFFLRHSLAIEHIAPFSTSTVSVHCNRQLFGVGVVVFVVVVCRVVVSLSAPSKLHPKTSTKIGIAL